MSIIRKTSDMGLCATLMKTLVFMALFFAFFISPSQAQLLGASSLAATQTSKLDNKANLIVEADNLIYDTDKKIVNLKGKVKIYYDGRTLEADRVEYNQTSKRMKAFDNVRLTDRGGNIVTGASFDIDDKFTDGFIAGLNLQTPDRVFIGARSATRSEGSITTFEQSAYTACERCKDNPNARPMWQIKASKVVHKEKEKTIYFHNAHLEFLGVPIAYIPYFWVPDHAEKRKSGFLSPTYISSNTLGFGLEQSYYQVISPNHDFTFSPTYFSKQGVLLKGDWRYATDSLTNTVQGGFINQQSHQTFANNSGAYPYIETPGARVTRYYVNVKGNLKLTPQWNLNWDLHRYSDRLFMRDYNLQGAGTTEANSTVSLTGIGNRSYFDARVVQYQGLALGDRQVEIPDTFQLDYSKSFGKVLGGELSGKLNAAVVNRDQADFDARNNRTLWDPVYNRFYDGCDSMTSSSVTPTSNNRFDCLLKGLPGNYTRVSAQVDWRRKIYDPIGQVFEPFMGLRGDLAFLSLRNNTDVTNFLGPGLNPNTNITKIMPTIGLNYRFPFVAQMGGLHSTIEPIAQLIIRPNENSVGRMPNEDAQSLVFDDSTLFLANKFSGWDRHEGGGRLNYGLNYTGRFSNGFLVNAMIGQSAHLFGVNSFIYGDPNNSTNNLDPTGTGANSGLDKARSDYVARLMLRPNDTFQVSSRSRFDKDSMRLMRNETDISFLYKRMSFVGTYAYFGERPLLGYHTIRQGVGAAASYKINSEWTSFASMRYDLDMNRFDGATAGVNYIDDCFNFGLFYTRSFAYGAVGAQKPPDDHRFMLRLSLRTVGDIQGNRQLLQ